MVGQYCMKNEQSRFYPTTLGLALVDGYDNIGEVPAVGNGGVVFIGGGVCCCFF